MLQRKNVSIIGEKNRFPDRLWAGHQLAQHIQTQLLQFSDPDPIVMGLPRGGIVVAAPIAQALGCPLDFVVTRKLHAPHQKSLVIGAVTERGKAFVNKPVIEALGLDNEALQSNIDEEQLAIQAAVSAYRSALPATSLAGKTIIVADDNVITGSTMFATLRTLWAERPQHIILAIPVAPRTTLMTLGDFADQVLALRAPTESFANMKDYYDDFPEVSEQEVVSILGQFALTPNLV